MRVRRGGWGFGERFGFGTYQSQWQWMLSSTLLSSTLLSSTLDMLRSSPSHPGQAMGCGVEEAGGGVL